MEQQKYYHKLDLPEPLQYPAPQRAPQLQPWQYQGGPRFLSQSGPQSGPQIDRRVEFEQAQEKRDSIAEPSLSAVEYDDRKFNEKLGRIKSERERKIEQ